VTIFKKFIEALRTPNKPTQAIPVYPTGILGLDKALQGGYKGGTIIELYGEPSSAKTTLALLGAKVVTNLGYKALYISSEDTYYDWWVYNIGINTKNFHEIKETNLKVIYNIIVKALKFYTNVKYIVIDSLSSTIMENESHLTLSKYAAFMFRNISCLLKKNNAILIIINQFRKMSNKYIMTTANTPLKVFAYARIRTSIIDEIFDNNGIPIGIKVNLSVNTKNVDKVNVIYSLYFKSKQGGTSI
jgi:recombination protein RecA